MQIFSNNSNQITFRGYDARPLRGILTRDFGGGKPFYSFLNEITSILNKENVDVFVQTSDKIIKNDFRNSHHALFWPFTQDRITFFRNNSYVYNESFDLTPKANDIGKFFNINRLTENGHIEGGNFFFIKDKFGESVIIGKDEFKIHKFNEIQKFFGKKNLCPVFQPDYHIDLSIRPLNNRNVLVHDPGRLLDSVQTAFKNATKIFEKDKSPELENVIKNLGTICDEMKQSNIQHDLQNRYKRLRQDLKSYKFNVIRVPGCIIEPSHSKTQVPMNNKPNVIEKLLEENKYILNYMNAIVHERPDRSLIYITNKSNLDEKIGITPEIAQKIDFSFEQMFINNLKGYVSPKDVKFVSGDNNFISNLLYSQDAGLHCLFSEIPLK